MIEHIFLGFFIISFIVAVITVYRVMMENKKLSDACEKLIERNQTLQINVDELFEASKGRDQIIDQYEKFIQTFSDNLSEIDNQLKIIDNKGMFKSDDDVGFVFSTINLVMQKLQQFNVNNTPKEEIQEANVKNAEKKEK